MNENEIKALIYYENLKVQISKINDLGKCNNPVVCMRVSEEEEEDYIMATVHRKNEVLLGQSNPSHPVLSVHRSTL